METRKSVRWILSAGCLAIAASLAFAILWATREPNTEDTAIRPRQITKPPSPERPDRWSDRGDHEPDPRWAAGDAESAKPRVQHREDPLRGNVGEAGLPLAIESGSVSDLDEATRAVRTHDLVRAGLIPEYEDGEFLGLRVTASLSNQQNFLQEIGMSKGDLITSINDRRAQDPNTDPTLMLQELSAQRSLDFVVVDSEGGEWRRSVD